MAARITRIRYGDGVNDVIDFEDPDSGFKIVVDGYRPTVAKRKRGALGGERVTRVVDTMLLTVSGASAGAANDRVDLLNAVIDQAQAWRDGAAVHVVTIEYRVEGSVLANPQQAAITGQPPGGDVVQLPFNYDSATSETVIGSFDDPLVFSFERRGEWLGDEDEDTSTTVSNCEKMTVALTATTVPSPTKMNMGVFSSDNLNWRGLIVTADSADGILLYDAEDLGASGDWTVATDTTNFARGDDILVFTPTSTIEQAHPVSLVTSSLLNPSTRLLAVLFNARNSSASDDFYVRFAVTGRLEQKSTSRVVIGAGETDPLWRLGGIIALGSDPRWIDVHVQPSGISSGPTLEVDTIAVVTLDRGGGIVSIPNEQTRNNSFVADYELSVDHNFLTKPLPGVAMVGPPSTEATRGPISFQGSAAMYTQAADVTAVYLSTGGADSRHWRRSNNAGTAPQQFYAQVRRRPSYLVPR